MKHLIQKGLESYGLNKQQSQVYMALVRVIDATVTDIEKKTHIPRATIYKALEKLRVEGLVSVYTKNKVKRFSVTSLKQVERNISQKLLDVQEIMPLLQNLASEQDEKPTTIILEGKDGVKIMWEEIYKEVEKMSDRVTYCIAGAGAHGLHPYFFKEYKKKVASLKPRRYFALPEQYRSNREIYDTRVFRFFPEKFTFDGTVYLAGDTLFVGSFDEKKPMATIIRSPQVAGIFKKIWELVWAFSVE